jgi:MFS family permease
LAGRSPPFAALLAARAVSLIGDGVGGLALIVHVQATEGTGTAVGLLLLAASLPRLLSPLAGAVAGRMDQRVLLAGGELGQGILLGVAVIWLPPLPVLLALLLAKATIVTASEPAVTSAVPALVVDDDLLIANTMLGGLRQAGEVVGPLLGGVIVAGAGVRAGLAVDALTFLVSVPLLARMPAQPAGAPRATVLAEAREGLTYAMRDRVVGPLTLGFFLIGLAAGDDVALPFLARVLGAGERGIGLLYAAVGAGLVLGYLIVAGRARHLVPMTGLVAGAVVAGLGNTLTGMSPVIVGAVAFQLVRGAGIAVYETMLQTLLQRVVPRQLLGRVLTNVYGAVNLGACVGLLGAGPLLDATSPRTVLVVSGAVGMLSAVISFRSARMSP